MSAQAPAITVANAHIAAWSNHDFDAARTILAEDVKAAVTSTNPALPETHTTGIDDYMTGLTQFARGVVPGSAHIIASVGDERNALLMLTVEADLGAGKATLPGARLYLLDENNKIKAERVVFFAIPD